MKGILVLGLVAIGSIACGPVFYDDAVRSVAREQFRCSDTALTIADLGSYQYRVEGCGRRAKYACTTGHATPVCVRMGAIEIEHAASHELPPASLPRPAEPDTRGTADLETERRLEAAVLGYREDILACAGVDRVGVRVTWSADRPAEISVIGPLSGTAEERCVQRTLATIPGLPTNEGSAVILVRAE